MRVHSNGGVEAIQTESASGLNSKRFEDIVSMVSAHKADLPHHLLEQVEAMSRSGEKVDPGKLTTIKNLVDDDLIPALVATQQAAQAQVQRNLAAVQTCNDKTSDKLSEIENTTESQVDQKRQAHVVARTEEKEMISDRDAKCKLLTEFVQSIDMPAK